MTCRAARFWSLQRMAIKVQNQITTEKQTKIKQTNKTVLTVNMTYSNESLIAILCKDQNRAARHVMDFDDFQYNGYI